MVLTSKACPIVSHLKEQVQRRIEGLQGVRHVKVNVLDEPWNWDHFIRQQKTRAQIWPKYTKCCQVIIAVNAVIGNARIMQGEISQKGDFSKCPHLERDGFTDTKAEIQQSLSTRIVVEDKVERSPICVPGLR